MKARYALSGPVHMTRQLRLPLVLGKSSRCTVVVAYKWYAFFIIRQKIYFEDIDAFSLCGGIQIHVELRHHLFLFIISPVIYSSSGLTALDNTNVIVLFYSNMAGKHLTIELGPFQGSR